MFNNGKQTPAYGNEKSASQMIIELQDKNATLRLALGKLLNLCENTKMQDESEIWQQMMGISKEALTGERIAKEHFRTQRDSTILEAFTIKNTILQICDEDYSAEERIDDIVRYIKTGKWVEDNSNKCCRCGELESTEEHGMCEKCSDTCKNT